MQDTLFSLAVGIATGVTTGLVSSGLFLWLLSTRRPNVTISDKIAKYIDYYGNTAFGIKIINRTSYPIVSVRAELHIVASGLSSGGPVGQTRPVDLKRSSILNIGKYDKKDKDATYAFRFVTYEDLEAIWKDDPNWYARITVYAEHELTGFGKAFYQRYPKKTTSIVCGQFQFGDTFRIDEEMIKQLDDQPADS